MTSDQISFSYSQEFPKQIEHNTHMFKEDLSRYLFPIRNNKDIQFTLSPHNPTLEKQITDLFPSFHENRNTNFSERLIDIIELIANILANDGICAFEFATLTDLQDEKKQKFEIINCKKFKITKKYLRQFISEYQMQKKGINVNYVDIPRTKCLIIKFPIQLGGEKRYNQFISNLRTQSEKVPLLNYFNNPLTKVPGYQVLDHQKNHELMLYRLTSLYMWNHRKHSNEMFTGFYNVYRTLVFKRFKVILRDHIINTLKDYIFSKYDKKYSLEVTGLFGLNEVDAMISEWELGKSNVHTIGKFDL